MSSLLSRGYRVTPSTLAWKKLFEWPVEQAGNASMAAPNPLQRVQGNGPVAPQQGLGPEWPKWEDVEYDAALVICEVFIWESGAKLAVGLNADGKGLWGRLSVPKWSPRIELQGMSAITFASGFGHLVRKLAQLPDYPASGAWKPDPYAK